MDNIKRSGRRSGNPDTKGHILSVARSQFATHTYSQVTVRKIADLAGVDAALVHHYFGTKKQLFEASVQLPINPEPVITTAIETASPQDVGANILRAFLHFWEGPQSEQFLAIMRTSFGDANQIHLVRNIFEQRIVGTLHTIFKGKLDHLDTRAALIASQMFGLILTRRMLQLEQLAALDHDELVEIYAPTLQRYLTMPLPSKDTDLSTN